MLGGKWFAAPLYAALVLASPAFAADKASAVLKDPSGKEVGTATLATTPSGTLITLELTAAPPGTHGFHIHTVGKCEPTEFESAGGHFNPAGKKHGIKNPDGHHNGDLPLNLTAAADGKQAQGRRQRRIRECQPTGLPRCAHCSGRRGLRG